MPDECFFEYNGEKSSLNSLPKNKTIHHFGGGSIIKTVCKVKNDYDKENDNVRNTITSMMPKLLKKQSKFTERSTINLLKKDKEPRFGKRESSSTLKLMSIGGMEEGAIKTMI